MMKSIQIDNGKRPEDPYNAKLGFWLPPDSPYGNFQLKLMKLCERLDEANRRLSESCRFWKLAKTQGIVPVNSYQRHVYANEQAIYLIRRTADELISFIWCLNEWEANKSYPKKIKVDSISGLLKQSSEQMPAYLFRNHITTLDILNKISNAFKHSFIQSDITLLGRDEPCVHAFALSYNDLDSKTEFHSVSLASLIKEFNLFYKTGIEWLSSFSERNC